MSGLALLGVVQAAHPSAGGGHGGLEVVRWGDLAVLAEPAGPDGPAGPEDAVRHLETLSHLVLAGPVLPFPVGTVAPDPEAVRRLVLADRAAVLRRGLARLSGLAEVRVEVTFDPEDGARAAVAEDPALRDVRHRTASAGLDGLDGQLRLGERAAAAAARWWTRRAAELTGGLHALAAQSMPLPARVEHEIRTAYLVPLGTWDDVEAALLAARSAAAGEAEVTALGPVPAFSFLDGVLERAHDDPAQDRPAPGQGPRAPAGPDAPGPWGTGDAWTGSGRWGW